MGVFHFEGSLANLTWIAPLSEESGHILQNVKPPRCLVISGNLLSTIVTKSIIQPCAGPAPLLSSLSSLLLPWGPALIRTHPQSFVFGSAWGRAETQAKTSISSHIHVSLGKIPISEIAESKHILMLLLNLVDLQCCVGPSTFFYLFIWHSRS